jgi:hypothetical protein
MNLALESVRLACARAATYEHTTLSRGDAASLELLNRLAVSAPPATPDR